MAITASNPQSVPTPEIVLVHSSDIHVDDGDRAGLRGDDGTAGLRAVLATGRALRADVVLLAGDTFENNQLSAAILDGAGRLLAEAGMPIVILPGNHDPALPNSVYVRGGFARIPNVRILGVTDEEAVLFPSYDLETWTHAIRAYYLLAPLPRSRPPRPPPQAPAPHRLRP